MLGFNYGITKSVITTTNTLSPHMWTVAIAGKQEIPKQTPQPSIPHKDGERDFFWTYTEEPHRSRRQAIIKAHPEVAYLALTS